MLGVAIGDLHLDALTKYWANANQMQVDAAVRAAHEAKKEGVKHIVLLGDIAEGIKDATGAYVRLSEYGQECFLDMLLELKKLATVHVICGNHDFSSAGNTALNLFNKMSVKGLLSNVHIHTKPSCQKIDGAKISFLPHPFRQAKSGSNLAFAHYEVSGSKMDTGRRVEHDPSKDGKGCAYIQGHLHTKQKVGTHYYPGTLFQLSFGERLPKYYAIFRADPVGSSVDTRLFEPPFKLINLRVNTAKDLKAVSDSPLELYKLFVHESVRVPDTFLGDHHNIVNALEFGNEQELAALQEATLSLTESTIDLDIDNVLPSYLEAQGIPADKVERALALHKRLIDSHR